MSDVEEHTDLEFLCVTKYTSEMGPLRDYYHEALDLPIDYEVPGQLKPIAVTLQS